jgi:hypothetical protein
LYTVFPPHRKALSSVVTEPIHLGPISRMYVPPPNRPLRSYYFPHSQKHAQAKTKFSRSQVQLYSLRLVFLPHIRFTAKSAAPVGSSCQSRLCSSAWRINQKRAVLASAPLRAPLRSGD